MHRLPPRALLPLLAFALVVATPVVPAGAARGQDVSLSQLQAQRSQVRSEKAQQAATVDALEATDSQIAQALDDLSISVAAATQELEEAERGVSQAEADLAAATKAEEETAADLAELRETMKDQAISAYVNAPEEQDWALLSSDDPNEAMGRRTLMEFQSNLNLDVAEDFRSLQAELAIQREAKEEARSRAERHRGSVQSSLDELASAQARQQAFQDEVESRLDRELAEAQALAQLDSSLSGQITERQQALAAQLAAQRAAAAAAQQALSRQGRAASAPSRSSSASSSSSSSSGGGRGSGGGRVPSISGSGSIVSVGGIRVHQSIAGNLQRLLSAASAAGINFGGGGYRDPAGQIAVRRSNCGSSNYAIYEMPASQCSPPTARPGSSMHERGLAIDFTLGGRTLSRGSAGFNWLRANASSYGLYNLPSEPWHWSVNGN